MKLILALGTLAVASVTPLAAQTIVTQWDGALKDEFECLT